MRDTEEIKIDTEGYARLKFKVTRSKPVSPCDIQLDGFYQNTVDPNMEDYSLPFFKWFKEKIRRVFC